MLKDTPVNPSINRSVCTVCGRCAFVCPSLTISIDAGRPKVSTESDLGCLACGQCMAVCPVNAVTVSHRGLKPEDAFPLPPRAQRATSEAIEGMLAARRSTRNYLDKPLAQGSIDKLLSMAATAPMGFPPSDVGVVIINGKERVQDFARDICQELEKWRVFANPVANFFLRLTAGKATAGMLKKLVLPVVNEILDAREHGKDFLFYDAPCVIVFHYPQEKTADSIIACSFAVIAAESLGLGTCMIGTLAPALQGSRKLKEKWGVPPDSFPSMGLIVGHPAVEYRNGIKRRFASVKYL